MIYSNIFLLQYDIGTLLNILALNTYATTDELNVILLSTPCVTYLKKVRIQNIVHVQLVD